MDQQLQVNAAAADFNEALLKSVTAQIRVVKDKWGLTADEAGYAMISGLLRAATHLVAATTGAPAEATVELSSKLTEAVGLWAERQMV